LGDGDPKVRFYAAYSLKDFGVAASNAVPALRKVLTGGAGGSPAASLFYLRAIAAVALGKIGPSAVAALPELKAALLEKDSNLRGQAAVAIWRISSDVDATLPVLLQEMPRTIQESKWEWIIALGEMGPRARQAIPQLKTELKEDTYPWVLEYVTNALIKINSDSTPKAETR
jgi:HEAT repeat protein